jgi:tRNA(adenine34) deaminase
VLDLFAHPQLNHHTQVDGGVLAEQASEILQDFFRQKREIHRESVVALREDALRTPDRCFDNLPSYPWSPHFVSDIPSLAGLRMHYVDDGPRESENLYLCLHPIPGWSFSYRHWIADWIRHGIRVCAPDLIGFGKSDKPKREDAHSIEFHCRYLIEWLGQMDLNSVTLVVPQTDHPLVGRLMSQVPDRFQGLLVQPIRTVRENDAESMALMAPYPDAGHRAAERAFFSHHLG